MKSTILNLVAALGLALSAIPVQAQQPPQQGPLEAGNHGQHTRYGLPYQIYRMDAAGNSPEFSNILLEAQATVAPADIIAGFTTPKLLLPGVPGKTIYVHRIIFTTTTTSTAFTGGGALVAQYDASNAAVINTVPAAVVTAAAGTSRTLRVGIDATAHVGEGIELTNATAVFAAGTGNIVVGIQYSLF